MNQDYPNGWGVTLIISNEDEFLEELNTFLEERKGRFLENSCSLGVESDEDFQSIRELASEVGYEEFDSMLTEY